MAILIEIAIVAAAVWLVWRSFMRQKRARAPTVKRGEATVRETAAVTLVKDPVTGVYRAVDPKA